MKLLFMSIALLLTASLIACAAPAPALAPAPAPAPAPAAKQSYQWRLSTQGAKDDPLNTAAYNFAKEVLNVSGGRIKIDVFPENLLGDWQSAYEETMRGTIEIDATCLSSVYDPRTGIVYIPYLVTGWADVKVLYAPGGFVYDKTAEILRGQGIELLSSHPSDFMGVGLRGKPPANVKVPKTPKGLKVRVWADPAAEGIMKGFGYMPTVLPWSEVYTSMQMGVVDGVYTNCVSMYNWVRDLTKTWVYDHSLFEGWFFIMNQKLFNSLSAEDKNIVKGAILKQQDIRMAQAEKDDLATVEKWRTYGVEVVTFTPEELASFRDSAIKDIWPDLYPKIGRTILDEAAAWLKAHK